MNRAEQILYSVLEEAIKKYGEGNVPRETLEEMWNTYPEHLWRGLKEKGILTKEGEMCYLDVSRET